MAAYDPPTQNLPIFDADYFLPDTSEPLTRKEAESMFVKNTNAFVSNSLNVGGTTTLLGTLSIPSYPDVTSTLNSIGTANTGITYDNITDTTTIDNNTTITKTLAIPSYPNVTSTLNNINTAITGITYNAGIDMTFIDNNVSLTTGKVLTLQTNLITPKISAGNGLTIDAQDGISMNGDLSIPSYPDVGASIGALETKTTGISYYATATPPYVADSTLIDNSLYVPNNSYIGDSISNYTFATSGNIRGRRNFNLIDTRSVIKIARFNNTNPPILEFEGWNTADMGVTWAEQFFWQMRANNTNIQFQNYITSNVTTAGTTSFEIGCASTATPNNKSYLPLDMNGQIIRNIDVTAATANTYGDMKYDVANKALYYKPAVYGQFSLSTDFTLTSANTEYIATYDTTTNALNCAVQGSPADQIRVDVSGVYRIAVSPNILSSSSNTETDFWFKKNGNNIANSCSRITTKSGNDLPFVEIIETLNATDYIQIAFSADATGVSLDATGTQTTPTRPATPAIIVTLQRIN